MTSRGMDPALRKHVEVYGGMDHPRCSRGAIVSLPIHYDYDMNINSHAIMQHGIHCPYLCVAQIENFYYFCTTSMHMPFYLCIALILK